MTEMPTTAPEWMRQRIKIQRGEITWDDLSFLDRTCKGWLWPYLLEIDSAASGRWAWWFAAHDMGKLPDSGIPCIKFLASPDQETMKMLEKCLDDIRYQNYSLRDFLDWLLWGFGEGDALRIDDKTNEAWYKTFNLGLMMVNPYDYLGDLYSNTKGNSWSNPGAFFPTPHNVVKCMVAMTMTNSEHSGKDTRLASVCDPCVGTGRMLMEASNYSVNLYGIDIDYTCVAACKVNGYLYMPWTVRPAAWVKSQDDQQEDSFIRNQAAEIIAEIEPEHGEIQYETTQKSGVHRFQITSGPAKRTKFKCRGLTPAELRGQYEKAVQKSIKAKQGKEAKCQTQLELPFQLTNT